MSNGPNEVYQTRHPLLLIFSEAKIHKSPDAELILCLNNLESYFFSSPMDTQDQTLDW